MGSVGESDFSTCICVQSPSWFREPRFVQRKSPGKEDARQGAASGSGVEICARPHRAAGCADDLGQSK